MEIARKNYLKLGCLVSTLVLFVVSKSVNVACRTLFSGLETSVASGIVLRAMSIVIMIIILVETDNGLMDDELKVYGKRRCITLLVEVLFCLLCGFFWNVVSWMRVLVSGIKWGSISNQWVWRELRKQALALKSEISVHKCLYGGSGGSKSPLSDRSRVKPRNKDDKPVEKGFSGEARMKKLKILSQKFNAIYPATEKNGKLATDNSLVVSAVMIVTDLVVISMLCTGFKIVTNEKNYHIRTVEYRY